MLGVQERGRAKNRFFMKDRFSIATST